MHPPLNRNCTPYTVSIKITVLCHNWTPVLMQWALSWCPFFVLRQKPRGSQNEKWFNSKDGGRRQACSKRLLPDTDGICSTGVFLPKGREMPNAKRLFPWILMGCGQSRMASLPAFWRLNWKKNYNIFLKIIKIIISVLTLGKVYDTMRTTEADVVKNDMRLRHNRIFLWGIRRKKHESHETGRTAWSA